MSAAPHKLNGAQKEGREGGGVEVGRWPNVVAVSQGMEKTVIALHRFSSKAFYHSLPEWEKLISIDL